ncbi:MAG: PfkB family carbohydrate kinase, partial [Pseudomonadota bacterium]
KDAEGHELIAEAQRMGMICDHIYRSEDLPTDVYMAVEGANGLIAAIADAHSLEAAGAKILRALENGMLGTQDAPFAGAVALDGNLTVELLQSIAKSPLFRAADLRVAPASPGKAERLLALIDHPSATLYVNLEEAGLLCQTTFADSSSAATALIARGAHRVLVTDGGRSASEGTAGDIITQTPPAVMVTRVTGAGDTFMAAHIASEAQGMDRAAALSRALNAAATYVSGETPL